MFPNEVPVKPSDKETLTDLLKRAQAILDQYPYGKPGVKSNTVTTISRAKTAVNEAASWCRLLETE